MGRLLGRRPAAPAKSKGNALPPLRIQSLFNRWDTGGWRLEFDSWVFKYELVRAIFSDGALPTGFTLEPTRKDEAPTELTLYWTLRWPGHTSVPRAQLTGFGRELAARAVSGTGEGEELSADRWYREGQEDLERTSNQQHNAQWVPALGMTGAQALKSLKPGIYVAAPGLPLRPIPPPTPDDKVPDVSFMQAYVFGGVFVYVRGNGTEVTAINIREIGAYERFWKDMIWYMQRGDDLAAAEKHYIELWDQLNRMMLFGFAIALTSAPSIGPRANITEPVLGMVERDIAREAEGMATRSVLKEIDPAEAVMTILQSYAVYQTVKGTVEDAQQRAAEREEEDAARRGDLFQLPVFIRTDADLEADDSSPAARTAPTASTAARRLARVPAKKAGAGARRPLRQRVQGFADAVADRYRDDIAAARKANPTGTASLIGIEAEKATLGEVPRLAAKWGLNHEHIWVGGFPVGVAGPKGGVITAEMGSTYYKFMIELKKSLRAVRKFQAEAHFLAVEEGINFPKGVRYFRIYGENFAAGGEMTVHETPVKVPRGGRR